MPATGCAPLFKGLLKGHSTPQQLCLVQPSESSAKDASPWGTPIRALHRVHVLGVHLCKGCKSLRYIYHRALQKVQVLVVHLSESYAKGASSWGTSTTELCKGKSLWYIYHRVLQRVQVLVVHLSELCKGCKSLLYIYQSSAKGASPCGTAITQLLQRVQVLEVHLSELCNGCKSLPITKLWEKKINSLRYTYPRAL